MHPDYSSDLLPCKHSSPCFCLLLFLLIFLQPLVFIPGKWLQAFLRTHEQHLTIRNHRSYLKIKSGHHLKCAFYASEKGVTPRPHHFYLVLSSSSLMRSCVQLDILIHPNPSVLGMFGH